MNSKQAKRLGLGVALACVMVAAAVIAHERSTSQSSDDDRVQKASEHFQKWDKNSDGYLTADEVGDKRWEHIKVADSNNDQKVSLAEFQQAVKDGKIGRHERNQN